MLGDVRDRFLQHAEQGESALRADGALAAAALEANLQPVPRGSEPAVVGEGADQIEVLLHHPQAATQLLDRVLRRLVQVAKLLADGGQDGGARL